MSKKRRKQPCLSDQALALLAARFRALADPTRLRILNTLMQGESSVGELIASTGLEQPSVSRHLIVLRREGTRTLILSRDDMAQVSASFDLRSMDAAEMIVDALARMVGGGGSDVIRVIGAPTGLDAEAIEITLDSGPLKSAMTCGG